MHCSIPSNIQGYAEPDTYGHPRFYEIIEELKQLHSDKNHDYASADNPLSNLTASKRINLPPWIACLVRIQDKIGRLEEFACKDELKVKDESITDTLNDLANYAILCRILYEEKE